MVLRGRGIGESVAGVAGVQMMGGPTTFQRDDCPKCQLLRQELASVQAEVDRLTQRGNEMLELAQQWESRALMAEDYPELVKRRPHRKTRCDAAPLSDAQVSVLKATIERHGGLSAFAQKAGLARNTVKYWMNQTAGIHPDSAAKLKAAGIQLNV